LSLAAYTNRVARAESRAVDLGIIGTTLAAEPCDGGEPALPADRQPQPLRAETGDPGAADGLSATEAGLATKSVRATDEPRGTAETAVPAGGVPGVVEIGGGRSVAEAGFAAGRRLARAVTEIGALRLGGGLVVLRNLRWEVRHESGAADVREATFSIGDATVGGVSLPTSGPTGVTAVLSAANAALAPLGIRIDAPEARVVSGVVFLDPLTVSVVPAGARDDVLGAVVAGVQPVREAAFAPLTEGCTDLSSNGKTAVTVFDIVLGSLTGAGSFTVALGGVQATTGEIAFSNVLGRDGGPGDKGTGTAVPTAAGSPPASAGAVGAAVGPPVPATAAAPEGGRRQVAAPVLARSGGARSALGAAAVATLVLCALAAAADGRRLRRAVASGGGP
jgi:hypothetical protein